MVQDPGPHNAKAGKQINIFNTLHTYFLLVVESRYGILSPTLQLHWLEQCESVQELLLFTNRRHID